MNNKNTLQPGLFIVVHVGAGRHSRSHKAAYESLCTDACNQAVRIYKELCSTDSSNACLQALSVALQMLESSPLTNAGYGSSLTLNGRVECEAGIMCGQTHLFAGVGAVSLLEHPIAVATALLQNQKTFPLLPGGRIPPSVLVSDGAHQWAKQHDFPLLDNEQLLISQKANDFHKKIRSRLNKMEEDQAATVAAALEEPHKKRPRLQLDTIGAVCMNEKGEIFAAASSGGIPLKYEGRLGHSCVFGAACWANQASGRSSVGFCNSGSGEVMVRSQLAQKCGQIIERDIHNPPTCSSSSSSSSLSVTEILQKVFKENLHCPQLTFPDPQRLYNTTCLGGTVGLVCDIEANKVDVVYCHNTHSLVLAYKVPALPKTVLIFSENSTDSHEPKAGCIGVKFH